MTQAQFLDFMRNYGPVITTEITGAYDEYESMIPTLFNRKSTQNHTEKTAGVTGTGLMQLWHGGLDYDNPEALWSMTRAHKRFNNAVSVSPDMIEDLMIPQILARVTSLPESARQSQEVYAAEVYNEADQTTMTYENESFSIVLPDTKALCATDHPYTPTDSGTQSNKSTNAFSPDNLKAAVVAMKTFKNHRRQNIRIQPDTLLVGPYLEDNVAEIITAARLPQVMDNDANSMNPGNSMNIWAGGLRVHVWNYLDGTSDATSPWFVIDSKLLKRSMMWFDRIAPKFENDSDFNTKQARWSAEAKWSILANDWRWIHGNFPA